MKGFSIPNTKDDVINNLAVDPDKTKEFIRTIYEQRHSWLPIKTLGLTGHEYVDENGDIQTYQSDEEFEIEDGVTRIVELKDEIGNIVNRTVEEYKLDPNCRLLKLGISDNDIDIILGQ